MFNAANILEALKNYIHTRGGTSNAYNIAEAVNDLNSIPQGSGGDIPPEVSNSVETHGMGWTSEEEVSGFDITWDGNTEGLESLGGRFFKISDKVYTEDELVGANGEYIINDIVYKGTVSLFVPEGSGDDMDFLRYYSISGDVPESFGINQSIMVILEDTEIGDEGEAISFHKGIYFYRIADVNYTSHIYKEASTKEIVHQINQKYIPQGSSGGGMVVNFNVQVSGDEGVVSADKTPAEVIAAALTGPVMGTLISPDIGFTEISPLGSVVFIDPSSPAFWIMSIKNNEMHYFISAEDDNWVVSFM